VLTFPFSVRDFASMAKKLPHPETLLEVGFSHQKVPRMRRLLQWSKWLRMCGRSLYMFSQVGREVIFILSLFLSIAQLGV
jgi:hypothetical protein